MQNGAYSSKMRLKMELIKRFFNPPEYPYFLFGPRGTGKSLWTKMRYPEALVIDLLDSGTEADLASRPERLIQRVEGELDKGVIVIDEIQKVPKLLDVVHLLIEKHRERRLTFVLTGSSARKLRAKGVNLLGGRALSLKMHPYMAAEMGDYFNLEKALRLGMLPLVVGSQVPEQVLKAYVTSYLREEVKVEGFVRDVGAFGRFLEAMSFSQGGVLNNNNIARECQVGRKAVEGYLSILEDLLVAFKLNVFSKRAKRELAHHPKFYYFDCGVFRALRPRGFVDSNSEIEGLCIESLVAQHLRAWCDYSDGEHALYYWRTRSNIEVDFVIQGETGLYAYEVKNATHFSNSDLRALKNFGEDYPEAKRFFLYRGKDRLRINDILCLPCEEFLLSLMPNRPPVG